jgi:hypothetical protein
MTKSFNKRENRTKELRLQQRKNKRYIEYICIERLYRFILNYLNCGKQRKG